MAVYLKLQDYIKNFRNKSDTLKEKIKFRLNSFEFQDKQPPAKYQFTAMYMPI